MQNQNNNQEELLNENENETEKEDITKEVVSVKDLTPELKQRRENRGLIIAVIGTFFMSLNCFYAKVILRTYPNDFRSIPFLFMRGISIIFYGVIHTYITGIPVIRPTKVPFKFWFYLRASMNFFYNAFSISALWYLRASAVQIIILLSPLMVIVLSYFLLKEPLYLRYAIGSFMCILGSFLIIINEHSGKSSSKKSDSNGKLKEDKSILNIIIGVILALISAFCYAIINIASKILASHRVAVNTQIVYIGATNIFFSSFYILFFGGLFFKLGYIIMCIIHGLFFYLYYITYNRSLQLAPVSKVIIITYLQIVFVFILADIFLHEGIFFTDVIGAGLIVAYMIYNKLYPIQQAKVNDKISNDK